MVPCNKHSYIGLFVFEKGDNMKIYLLCGKARSGKDTIANLMKKKLEASGNKVCEIAIMRTLKGYLKDYFGWDGKEETKPRTLLQEMGQDILMDVPNFHVDRICEDIRILSKYFDTFIVPDVRMVHEIEEFRKRFDDVVVIGVVKENYVSPLTSEQSNHITERDLDNYKDFDYEIVNSDIDKLNKDIERVLGDK